MNKTVFKCPICGNERTIEGIDHKSSPTSLPTNCMGGGLVAAGGYGKWPPMHEQVTMQVEPEFNELSLLPL